MKIFCNETNAIVAKFREGSDISIKDKPDLNLNFAMLNTPRVQRALRNRSVDFSSYSGEILRTATDSAFALRSFEEYLTNKLSKFSKFIAAITDALNTADDDDNVLLDVDYDSIDYESLYGIPGSYTVGVQGGHITLKSLYRQIATTYNNEDDEDLSPEEIMISVEKVVNGVLTTTDVSSADVFNSLETSLHAQACLTSAIKARLASTDDKLTCYRDNLTELFSTPYTDISSVNGYFADLFKRELSDADFVNEAYQVSGIEQTATNVSDEVTIEQSPMWQEYGATTGAVSIADVLRGTWQVMASVAKGVWKAVSAVLSKVFGWLGKLFSSLSRAMTWDIANSNDECPAPTLERFFIRQEDVILPNGGGNLLVPDSLTQEEINSAFTRLIGKEVFHRNIFQETCIKLNSINFGATTSDGYRAISFNATVQTKPYCLNMSYFVGDEAILKDGFGAMTLIQARDVLATLRDIGQDLYIMDAKAEGVSEQDMYQGFLASRLLATSLYKLAYIEEFFGMDSFEAQEETIGRLNSYLYGAYGPYSLVNEAAVPIWLSGSILDATDLYFQTTRNANSYFAATSVSNPSRFNFMAAGANIASNDAGTDFDWTGGIWAHCDASLGNEALSSTYEGKYVYWDGFANPCMIMCLMEHLLSEFTNPSAPVSYFPYTTKGFTISTGRFKVRNSAQTKNAFQSFGSILATALIGAALALAVTIVTKRISRNITVNRIKKKNALEKKLKQWGNGKGQPLTNAEKRQYFRLNRKLKASTMLNGNLNTPKPIQQNTEESYNDILTSLQSYNALVIPQD